MRLRDSTTATKEMENKYIKCKKQTQAVNLPQQETATLQSLQSLQGLQGLQNVQTLTPLDQWHDNFEVMEMFHISQRTLQTLRSNGKLPFAKMGGRCYYKESDLQRLMEDSYRDSRINPMPSSPDKKTATEVKVEKGGKPWL